MGELKYSPQALLTPNSKCIMDYTTQKASFILTIYASFFNPLGDGWKGRLPSIQCYLAVIEMSYLLTCRYDTEKPGGLFHQALNKPLEESIHYTFFSAGAFLI